ncbi:MAG: hypothetical protein SXQ77_02760, partial [Halobacteria archaeon]|nr:hypothetical protein [Halobacteria archaeon]
MVVDLETGATEKVRQGSEPRNFSDYEPEFGNTNGSENAINSDGIGANGSSSEDDTGESQSNPLPSIGVLGAVGA